MHGLASDILRNLKEMIVDINLTSIAAQSLSTNTSTVDMVARVIQSQEESNILRQPVVMRTESFSRIDCWTSFLLKILLRPGGFEHCMPLAEGPAPRRRLQAWAISSGESPNRDTGCSATNFSRARAKASHVIHLSICFSTRFRTTIM